MALSVAVILGMSSCKKFDTNPDPMAPGLDIYSWAFGQNNYALDPVAQAVRLNILLSEAARQGVEDLSEVVVDNKGTEVSLKDQLFSSNTTVVKEAGGQYVIKYAIREYWDNGGRDGVININTGGKLLDELSSADAWTVNVDKNNYDTYRHYYYNWQGNYLEVSNAGAIIAGTSVPGSWNILVEDYVSVSNEYGYQSSESLWSCDFTFSFASAGDGWAYEDIVDSELEFYGYGGGDSFVGVKLTCTIDSSDPLIYSTSCGGNFIKAGTVHAGFDIAQMVDPANYPSRYVDVEFVDKGSCSSGMVMTYNGKTENY
jgi:hypothetical protein